MTMTEAPTTNRFPGSCGRCGAKVPAEAGIYARPEGVQHATEDECKKTTKTWKTFENRRRFEQAQADSAAAWAAAGFPSAATFNPMSATTQSSTVRHGTVDGVKVTVVEGGMPHGDRSGWDMVRVRVDGHEITRFTLDRDAIKTAEAAYDGSDAHRRTVLRNQAEIDQIVAGVREALA